MIPTPNLCFFESAMLSAHYLLHSWSFVLILPNQCWPLIPIWIWGNPCSFHFDNWHLFSCLSFVCYANPHFFAIVRFYYHHRIRHSKVQAASSSDVSSGESCDIRFVNKNKKSLNLQKTTKQNSRNLGPKSKHLFLLWDTFSFCVLTSVATLLHECENSKTKSIRQHCSFVSVHDSISVLTNMRVLHFVFCFC